MAALTPRFLALALLCGAILFVVWFVIASSYDYGDLAGTYTYKAPHVESTLILRSDRSFHQSLTADGKTRESDGEWRRIGQATVVFPEQFLRLPGQRSNLEEFPDVNEPARVIDFAGHFDKVLGIYPVLNLNANPPGPILKKKMF